MGVAIVGRGLGIQGVQELDLRGEDGNFRGGKWALRGGQWVLRGG